MDLADIYAIRRSRLQDLIDGRFDENQAALSVAIGRSASQVNQWLSGHRSITDPSRDLIESKCGLPPGWLDAPPAPTVPARPEVVPTASQTVHSVGMPRYLRPIPVVGTAKLGEDGYYEELQHPAGHGDGWVDGYSADPNAYALAVKGDSMYPAIRHGSFVVVAPNARCVAGEFVVVSMLDGRKMVKELVIERATEVVIESVNGGQRQTLDRSAIEQMHSIAAVVSASHWRPS